MLAQFRLFPEAASEAAARTDQLYFFLLLVAAFFTFLICGLIVYFSLRYRRTEHHVRAIDHPQATLKLEIAWAVVPLMISLTAFGWGAEIFLDYARPPTDAREVFVLGKQWMWRVQHPEGKVELNELHLARGRPVRLTMTSEDVIHSFYVPAFRKKQDAVPGRYSSLWFKPTRTGMFDLYCAEYCGADHAVMIGKVVVMEPAAFQTWIEGGPRVSMAEQGKQLFEKLACQSCHKQEDHDKGPNLYGLPGSRVQLRSGRSMRADDDYLRDSIMNPAQDVVAGYQPNMPNYSDQLDESDVWALIAYIKSLSTGEDAS